MCVGVLSDQTLEQYVSLSLCRDRSGGSVSGVRGCRLLVDETDSFAFPVLSSNRKFVDQKVVKRKLGKRVVSDLLDDM